MVIRWVADHPVESIIISIIYTVVCLALSAMLLIMVAIKTAPSVPCPKLTDMEMEEVKSVHRFHGIMASEEDEWGRWWFTRDGEKCWIRR